MSRQRGQYVATFEDLREWTRDYAVNGQLQQRADRRFAIGLYQVGQALEWAGTASESESWAAACIHWIAVAEQMELVLPNLGELQSLPYVMRSDAFLLHVAKAQQEICYGTTISKGTRRKSRYNAVSLQQHLAWLVRECLQYIPPKERTDALFTAMEIMTGAL